VGTYYTIGVINEFCASSKEILLIDQWKEILNERIIKIETNFAMMMIEGKVIIEEFYTDPHLINWLFRNSNIPNKLSGAVISSVTF
jgi:hypothetical protein